MQANVLNILAPRFILLHPPDHHRHPRVGTGGEPQEHPVLYGLVAVPLH